jgi:hypothetical protein
MTKGGAGQHERSGGSLMSTVDDKAEEAATRWSFSTATMLQWMAVAPGQSCSLREREM